MNKIKLFLVDDDAVFLKLLEIEFLKDDCFSVQTFATGELCLESLSKQPDVIILDYNLDGIDKNAMNGMATFDKIKAIYPHIPIVILSSQDEIDLAVNFISHKAFDFVVKNDSAFMRIKKALLLLSVTKKLQRNSQFSTEIQV
jgi:two-component system OmpR family response regulator